MKTSARLTSDGAALRQASPAAIGSGATPSALLASLLYPAAVSVLFVVIYWNRMLSHDVAVYVLAARDWLDGAVLYRDVIDINPPLNFYLTVPAILLSDLLNLSPDNGAYVAFALLVFASLHWCFRILHDEQGMTPRDAGLMTLAVGFSLLVSARFEQIQRDGLLLVFMMPWLLSQLGPRPNAPGILRTVFFGIGVCLKPYFIVFPLMMTAYQVLRQRSSRPILSPSNLTLLAVGLSYGAFVALVHPLYFSDVVPRAREVYGNISAAPEFIRMRLQLAGLPVLGMVLVLALRARALPVGTGVFLTGVLASLASYLWQGKGFGYHLYPFFCFTFLTAFWVLFRGEGLRVQKVACIFTVGAILFGFTRMGFYHDKGIEDVVAMTEGLPAQSIWVLSTDSAAGPGAALAMRRSWAVRYPHNWVAPGVVDGRARTDCDQTPAACARYDELHRLNASQYATDLLEKRPGIAVIDKRRYFFEDKDFDWYAYMSVAPEFTEAMGRYELHASSENFDVYRYKK
ncbi:hypothetical protein [Tropicimonas sediminicola]|uniref:4-amino-4-deoxy-L-arabinose transferase n=1 Tax=Tropicimonas sediminicola TaxID=1031541 RepID=A0A239L5Z1_9RHOB|nr:hypothetical protein [Tropicimonas sediminicola]SNT24954.1 hypothetical protein SAMN05421757_108243 [Tropicimonas sediminicola]